MQLFVFDNLQQLDYKVQNNNIGHSFREGRLITFLKNISLRLIKYRTRAIISRGLYFFYPFFTEAAAYTADNLCTKQGNVGLKSTAYKRERLMIARVR